jgi:hypothetical protein
MGLWLLILANSITRRGWMCVRVALVEYLTRPTATVPKGSSFLSRLVVSTEIKCAKIILITQYVIAKNYKTVD